MVLGAMTMPPTANADIDAAKRYKPLAIVAHRGYPQRTLTPCISTLAAILQAIGVSELQTKADRWI